MKGALGMDIMNVASSMAMNPSKAMGQVGTRMLAKTLDAASSQAASEIDMLNQAAVPTPTPSADPALGHNFDAYA